MEKDKFGRIKPEDTALLMIDVQEKFVPHIHGIDDVTKNCVRLIQGCKELGVPIIVTEQYPKGLGRTAGPVAEALGEFTPHEKTAFSLFEDEAIAGAIKKLGRPNLLMAGIEAHVCLIKTALDGIAEGYNIHWMSDAISSRTQANADAARRRAIQCGAFSSSAEMALFQMLESSKAPAFRAISGIVK
ncbi:MAG: isochorismatase family protein [bacterium]